MIKVNMFDRLERNAYYSICADEVSYDNVIINVIRALRPQSGIVYNTKSFVWSEAKDKIFFF